MSEKQDQITQARDKVSRKGALIRFPFKLLWGIVKLMFWVLLIYLIVYFVIWALAGFDNTYALLQKNYDYLALRIEAQSAHSWLMTGFSWLSHAIQSVSFTLMDYLSSASHNGEVLSNIDRALDPYRMFGIDGDSGAMVGKGAGFLTDSIIIITMALLISMMKLASSLALISIYLVGVVLGIVTGNRKRLYRRLAIDRESGAKHQMIKHVGGYLPLCIIVVYMVLPFHLSVVLLLTLVGGITLVLFYMMVSTFKKYL